MTIKKKFFLSTLIFFLFPGGFVYAAEITNMTAPIVSGTYSYGSAVPVLFDWTLPPDWILRAGVTLASGDHTADPGGICDSCVEVAKRTVDNTNSETSKSGTVNLALNGLAPGVYTVQLVSDAGTECAINSFYNSTFGTNDTPTCSVIKDVNLHFGIYYPSRKFTVGSAPTPTLVVTPSTNPALNFANVPANTSQQLSFMVSNSGVQTLTGSVSSLPAPFSCVSGCSYVLKSGDPPQSVTIRFTPTSGGSSYSQTVNFSCNGSSGSCARPTETRQINGNSVVASLVPQVAVSTSPLNFGTVNAGGSKTLYVDVSNVGGGTLNGTVSLSSTQFSCHTNGVTQPPGAPCSYRVIAGASPQNIRIIFSPPAGTSGPVNQTALFTGGTSVSVPLQAIVNNKPLLSVSPASWAAGSINVGSSVQGSFIVQNTGVGLLSGAVTGLPSQGFSCVSGCTYSNLAPGILWPVTLRFQPTNTNAINTTANFTNTQGTNIPVSLTGRGNTQPQTTLSQATLNFGNVIVGQTVTRTTTLTNTGVGTLSGNVAGLGRGFACVSGCSFNLSAGAGVVLTFSFTPTVTGVATINPLVGGAPLALTGVGLQPTFELTTDLIPPVSATAINPTFNAAVGGVSSIIASNDATNLYYEVNYTLSRTIPNTETSARAMLNTDMNTATGYGAQGLDYYVNLWTPNPSSAELFRYSGPNGWNWAWTKVKNLPVTYVSGKVKFVIPRADLGFPEIVKAQGSLSDPGTDTNQITQILEVPVTNYNSPTNALDFGTTTYGSPTQNSMRVLHAFNRAQVGTVSYAINNSSNFICTGADVYTACSSSFPYAGSNYGTTPLLQFRPTSVGQLIQKVTVNYNTGTGAKQLSFYARGMSTDKPVFSLEHPGWPSWDWTTSANVGSTVSTTYVVTNMGTSTLSGVASIVWPLGFSSDKAFTCTGCSFAGLAYMQTHNVTLNFTPKVGIRYPATLSFVTNGGNASSVLTGDGIVSPTILLNPSSALDMGTANTGSENLRSVMVTNIGLGSLNGTVNVVSGSDFQCVSGCSYALVGGASLDAVFRFAPLVTGSLSDSVQFISNAANGNQSLTIFGNGTFAPVIDLRSGDTDFGSVTIGKYVDHTFVVQNTGTNDLGSGTLKLTGPYSCINPVDPSDKLCHYTLVAGGQVTFTIRFQPTASGLSPGTVALLNSGGGTVGKFSLIGRGIHPTIKFEEK